MIKNFYPQAYPLWAVDFTSGTSIAEIVVGWTLDDEGNAYPVASGTQGGIQVISSDNWAVYADHDEAQQDADPTR